MEVYHSIPILSFQGFYIGANLGIRLLHVFLVPFPIPFHDTQFLIAHGVSKTSPCDDMR